MSDANTNLPKIFHQVIVYKECRHNHAASIGRICFDGCLEFAKFGDDGTEGALRCDACGCHRNFHRRETLYRPTTKVQNNLIASASASAPPIPNPSSSRVQRRQNLGNNNPEEAEFDPPRRMTRRRRRQQEVSNEQSSCTTKE